MANSSFINTNRKITVPVTVPNGGTGRTSLPDKSVLIGAGTGDVHSVAPGTLGNTLFSDGTDWTSGIGGIPDDSITYVKLDGDLVDRVVISAVNVDWSAGSIFTKTLTTNTTLTFSNYQLNNIITLVITGDYAFGFPDTVNTISGTYDGTVSNYIALHCINATGGSEEVWATISQ